MPFGWRDGKKDENEFLRVFLSVLPSGSILMLLHECKTSQPLYLSSIILRCYLPPAGFEERAAVNFEPCIATLLWDDTCCRDDLLAKQGSTPKVTSLFPVISLILFTDLSSTIP